MSMHQAIVILTGLKAEIKLKMFDLKVSRKEKVRVHLDNGEWIDCTPDLKSSRELRLTEAMLTAKVSALDEAITRLQEVINIS